MNPWHIASILLFVAFSLCRVVDLEADLPSYFDTGISVTDEGTYMDAPKKRVQTGRWNLPGEWWQSQKLVPLYSFALWKWFDQFGVGLDEGRSLSVVIGIITLIIVWLVGFRLAGPMGACALLIFVGSSYILTHFNRAAMVETMQLLFVWLAMLLITFRTSVWRNLALGLCCTCILLVKLSGALALPGLILWLVVVDREQPWFKSWPAFAAGVMLPLSVVGWYAPGFLESSFEYCRNNFGGLLDVKGAPWHLVHIPVRSMFLSREALVALLLLLLSLLMAPGRASFRKYRPFLWAFCGSILMAACVDFSVRRYLMFMPWMYVLALHGLVSSPEPMSDGNQRDGVLAMGQCLAILLCVSGIPMVFGHFGWIWPKYWVLMGVAASLLWFFKVVGIGFKLRHCYLGFKSRGRMVVLVGCLVFLACQQTGWFVSRTHLTIAGARLIAKQLDQESQETILVGNVAPMMVIESDRQARFLHSKMGDPFQWFGSNDNLFVCYTLPRPCYQSRPDLTIFRTLGGQDPIAKFDMFSESHLVRQLALFRLDR